MAGELITIPSDELIALADAAGRRAAQAVAADPALVREAVEAAVTKMLVEIGLGDEKAGHDVRDLRDFIDLLRWMRRRALMAVFCLAIAVASPWIVTHIRSWWH